LNEVDFVPNHFNPLVIEQGEKPEHGGMIYGYFISPSTSIADTILINGLPADPILNQIKWCEIVNPNLVAGEIGILRCSSYSINFDVGYPIDIQVKAGSEELWHISTTLPAPSLSPSYITPNIEGDEILVHVRNDGDARFTVNGLLIDGVDVSNFIVIDNPLIRPGEIATIHVPQCDSVPYGVWKVFTVKGADGKNQVSVSRSLRLFPPVFPLGDWNASGDDIFQDMGNLQNYLDMGINMFIYYPSPSNPPEVVLPLAEEKNFYVFTHEGNPDSYFIDFIQNWGYHPRLLANAVSGEGEFGDEPSNVLAKLQFQRTLWTDPKPMWIYNACSYSFPSWGSLADYSGMDHYCVWAPKCNTLNWPYFEWDFINFAAIYSEEIKLAAEPRPVWNWTQSANLNFRCVTRDEIRAQWYQVLSRGSKALLWFQYTLSTPGDCPNSYDELRVLAHELASLKTILLEGEMTSPGTVVTTNEENLDVTATVSPKGMIIFLADYSYGNGILNILFGYSWKERNNLVFDVMPPEGFEPMQFLLVDDENQIELEWQKLSDNHWRFTLPSFKAAAAILVVPEP